MKTPTISDHPFAIREILDRAVKRERRRQAWALFFAPIQIPALCLLFIAAAGLAVGMLVAIAEYAISLLAR